jgi:hypothetical protein
MSTRILFAVLAVVLMTSAATATPHSLVAGSGAISCGSWTADKQTLMNSDEVQWVLRFLSGVGAPEGMDSEAVTGWLDNYCRAHPLKNLSYAASAFVLEHPH